MIIKVVSFVFCFARNETRVLVILVLVEWFCISKRRVLQEMKLGSLLYLFSWNAFALAKEGF